MNVLNKTLKVCPSVFFSIFSFYLLAGCASDAEHKHVDILKAKLADADSNDVMIVAHRACWREGAPENSLAAIADCIATGLDMIEIDVALTADGVPILMHDETIDRTTNGSGKVAELSFEYIRSLRLLEGAGGSGATLTDQKVPTLKEALALAQDNILINLDIKGAIFDEAFAVVEELGVNPQILMKIAALPGSPELENAKFLGKTHFMPIIRECTPRYAGYVCSPDLSDVVPGYAKYKPVAYEITFTHEAYLIDGVAAIKTAGGRIWANSLAPHHAAGLIDSDAVQNPEAVWGRMVDLGVNIIQTDNPKSLLSYLKSSR